MPPLQLTCGERCCGKGETGVARYVYRKKGAEVYRVQKSEVMEVGKDVGECFRHHGSGLHCNWSLSKEDVETLKHRSSEVTREKQV